MRESTADVTLQINVCAGDVAYCGQTVPALVEVHRRDVQEVLVVMDCCRPQSTPFVHRPSRFPRPVFAERLRQLEAQCSRWLKDGVVNRVARLEGESRRLRSLNEKYTGARTAFSHDHLGHASAAYYLGWEAARTRYVLHFDGDILFHQQPGHSWVRQAVATLEQNARRLAVSPRIAPPPERSTVDTLVNLREMPQCGWMSTWPLEPVSEGWSSPWFSTRCHLLDRERLAALLPLTPTRGRAAYQRSHRCNAILTPLFAARCWTLPVPDHGPWNPVLRAVRKLGFKVPEFPLPPEVLIHEHNQRQAVEVVYLNDPKAWFIHPHSKPEIFHRLLPALLKSVSLGEFPVAQGGMCDIDFGAWESFLSSDARTGGIGRGLFAPAPTIPNNFPLASSNAARD
jgi:hypothetical protein